MEWQILGESAAKLLLASLIGGLIGFEREAHGQFAGLRTILLISVGSCLLMMLSLHMPVIFSNLGGDSILRVDPARIASYSIASMGFLGGGAIIKGKGSVRGLTTAASLWLVTGLGLAVGAGFYIPAVICTIISLLALYQLGRFKWLVSRRQFVTLHLTCTCDSNALTRVQGVLSQRDNIHVLFVNSRHLLAEGTSKFTLRLSISGEVSWNEISGDIMALPGLGELLEISWLESDVP